MTVYRILKEPYWHDPLSVVGAAIAGGRWNPPGVGVLYTATSPALALLETLVHFPRVGYEQLPQLRLFALNVPDTETRWIDPARLPDEWPDPTALPITQAIFTDWLQTPADLALGVPSAILDVSYNVLIHPDHPLYLSVTIISELNLLLDYRLWPLVEQVI